MVKNIISNWGIKKQIIFSKTKKFKEDKLLMISNKKAKKELNWSPSLNFQETIGLTVEWYKSYLMRNNLEKLTRNQIEFFYDK